MESTRIIKKGQPHEQGVVASGEISQEDRATLGSDPSAWLNLKDVVTAPPTPIAEPQSRHSYGNHNILRSESGKSRGVGGSAPEECEAQASAEKRLLDTIETTEPNLAGDDQSGRVQIKRQLRKYRSTGRWIAGGLKRSDYADELKNDIASLFSCGTTGKIWYLDEDQYHARWMSCRHRLCPVCEYKKVLHRRKLVESLEEYYQEKQGEWALITLTIPNASWDEDGALREADARLKEFCKALRRKWNMSGYIVGTETTMNGENRSYHHHMHMLIHFPDGLPAENLYRRIWWRGEWRVPLYHDERRKRYKISRENSWRFLEGGQFQGRFEWVKEAYTELETDESFIDYTNEHSGSIQYQWLQVSGYTIADIRRARNFKEVAKYIGKWSEIATLPPNILARFLFETKGLRRWIVGGEFRTIMKNVDLEKMADEEEATGDGWQEAWDIHEGLNSDDQDVREITEKAIEECLWSLYRPDELRTLERERKAISPPWVTMVLLSEKNALYQISEG